MTYVIFAVLLIVSNVLTFRFAIKKFGRTTVRDLEKDHDDKFVKDYVIQELDDAERILVTLKELADKHGDVSVSDYYDLIRVPSNLKDSAYGWGRDAIFSTSIVWNRFGYLIYFPPVKLL